MKENKIILHSNKKKQYSDATEITQYPYEIPSREQILALFEQNSETYLSKEEIGHLFNIPLEHFEGLRRRLRAMENSGQLRYSKQGYTPLSGEPLYIGTVIGHRDGHGFLRIDSSQTAKNDLDNNERQPDLILPFYQMKTLLPGDRISAHKIKADRKGRDQASIVALLEPFDKPIVGRLFIEEGIGCCVPEDNRFNHEIIIPPEHRAGARHGQVILVEIVRRPSRNSLAMGRVIEVLGENLAPGMEIEIALRTHNIPHVWPKSVEKQLQKIKDEVPDHAKAGRVDLRSLPLVTIDGEDARDFDDAVYCRAKYNKNNDHDGWTLWVAIADVSYYVRPLTALDNEAINRGTSVYFPAQVIPMLPELLSNGLCSLNPQVDRLCMVCEMSISADGALESYQHYEALMNSHARFTYTQVATMLDVAASNTEHPQENTKHIDLLPDLIELQKLYEALKIQRHQRGAIEFETNETRFVFNHLRKIERIEPIFRNDAHKMIEECMILANVASARFVAEHKEPALYRVHQQPSEEKLTSFKDFLAVRGLKLGGGLKPTPKDYMSLVEQLENRPDKEVIQTMLLRSMMQAVYQADNLGHFGLSLTEYAHFTSPIRRYPDLLLHRAIKYLIEKKNGLPTKQRWTPTGGYHYLIDEIDQMGEQCSIAERRADDATRDVADWLKCEFMQDHVGDTFDGIIAAVTGFGLFVRLGDYQIDGLLHISNLASEYFHFDSVQQKLIGEHSHKTYSIGDKIKVVVQSVNLDNKMIDLSLAGQIFSTLPSTAKKKSKNTAKIKTKHKDYHKSSDKNSDLVKSEPANNHNNNNKNRKKTKIKVKENEKPIAKIKIAVKYKVKTKSKKDK